MKKDIITPTGFSRRGFVKGGLAVSALAAFPRIVVGGKLAANERINLACCGIGNRGGAVSTNPFPARVCWRRSLKAGHVGLPHYELR